MTSIDCTVHLSAGIIDSFIQGMDTKRQEQHAPSDLQQTVCQHEPLARFF